MNGSSGPIARICGRIASEAMNNPAMTATGMAGLPSAAGRAPAVAGSDISAL
jgi:hypothetical protein